MTDAKLSRPSSRSPSPSGAGADGPTTLGNRADPEGGEAMVERGEADIRDEAKSRAARASHLAASALEFPPDDCYREDALEEAGWFSDSARAMDAVLALLAEQRELIGRLTKERDAALFNNDLERSARERAQSEVSRLSGEAERLTRERQEWLDRALAAETRWNQYEGTLTKVELERDEARGAADRMRAALESLVHPDNGYCNQCGGHWRYAVDGSVNYASGEHRPECPALVLARGASRSAGAGTTTQETDHEK
jgi:hypothetical protein